MCRPNLHPRRRVALLWRADFYRRGRLATPRAYLRRFPRRLTALELGGANRTHYYGFRLSRRHRHLTFRPARGLFSVYSLPMVCTHHAAAPLGLHKPTVSHRLVSRVILPKL